MFTGLKIYLMLVLLLITILLSSTTIPAVPADEKGFLKVTGPCDLSFPKDHGAHPGYRTEWWYYTGNLIDANQRPFGFQLTFFRSQLRPSQTERSWPQPASPWRSNQIFMAHAAISDIHAQHHMRDEKMSRGALGMAGVQLESDRLTINLMDWQTGISPNDHHLYATAENFTMDLTLVPMKAPVLHGRSGYSRKGGSAEQASCYYSYTRLHTQGTLTVSGQEFQVTGTSWMDHEFSSEPLEPGIIGWDWFSVQLSDQTELMIFLLRQGKNRLNPASSGTFVTSRGRSIALERDEISIRALDHWKSPHSEAIYPSKWRLTIDKLKLRLNVISNLSDQEMHSPQTTEITYWEGSVRADGERQGRAVSGSGYVELTGYAKPFDAPM